MDGSRYRRIRDDFARILVYNLKKALNSAAPRYFIWAWLCFAKIPLLRIERGNVIYG